MMLATRWVSATTAAVKGSEARSSMETALSHLSMGANRRLDEGLPCAVPGKIRVQLFVDLSLGLRVQGHISDGPPAKYSFE